MFLKRTTRRGHSYYLIAEGYRDEAGKVQHRTLANIGRIDDQKTVEKIRKKLKAGFNLADISSRPLPHGHVACLLQVINERGIIGQIDSCVNKSGGLKVGLTTALLAINRLDTTRQKAKMNFADWLLHDTSLTHLVETQPDLYSCENLCHLLDYFDPATCQAIDQMRTQSTPEIDLSEGLHYDFTSTFTFGHCTEMATYGYSRDHREDQQQVVIGLLNDINQIPITSHVEPGNASDMKLFPITAELLLPRFGLEKVTLIIDRGMISEENINKVVDELGHGIICMMRKSDGVTRRALAEARNREMKVLKMARGEEGGSLEAEVRGTSLVMEVYGHYRKLVICHNPLSGLQQKTRRRRKVGEAAEKLQRLKDSLSQRRRGRDQLAVAIDKCTVGVKRFVQVEVMAEREMNSFEFELVRPGKAAKVRDRLAKQGKELASLQQSLLQRESYSASESFIEKKLNKILGSDQERYEIKLVRSTVRPSISWTVDEAAIQVAEADDGWFVLMSSDLEATAEQVLGAYEGKDGIEKSFRSMKQVIDLRPLFHHKDNRIMAHVWICTLAQYIRRMFELKMEAANIDLSFEKAMVELQRIYWNEMEAEIVPGVTVRLNSTSGQLNETQRALLEAFAVPEIGA